MKKFYKDNGATIIAAKKFVLKLHPAAGAYCTNDGRVSRVYTCTGLLLREFTAGKERTREEIV